MGYSGSFPPWKPAATESHYPTYGSCRVFTSFHNPPNSDMDYRIFHVRTDVKKCYCAVGCTDTQKNIRTESWLWEKTPLSHRGIEPASAACRSDGLPPELHTYLGLLWIFTIQSTAKVISGCNIKPQASVHCNVHDGSPYSGRRIGSKLNWKSQEGRNYMGESESSRRGIGSHILTYADLKERIFNRPGISSLRGPCFLRQRYPTACWY